MKKLYSLIMVLVLVLVLLFAFAACSNNTNHDDSSPVQQQSDTQNTVPDEESGEANDASISTETDSKSLVVYFSWSGNTENVAKSIQSQTGSDIFEIIPATPYSDDYDTVVDLAQEEQRNNARPAISGSIENIEQYDIIYVGFPKMEQGYICV